MQRILEEMKTKSSSVKQESPPQSGQTTEDQLRRRNIEHSRSTESASSISCIKFN